MEPTKQRIWEELIGKHEDKHDAVGQTLALQSKVLRVECLEAACLSNQSVHSTTPWLRIISKLAADKLNDPRLLNDYSEVVYASEARKIEACIAKCYPTYSITIDGSPFFASAETTALTMITKTDFKRVTVVIRACLLKKHTRCTNFTTNDH
jgi:hypothetical protein